MSRKPSSVLGVWGLLFVVGIAAAVFLAAVIKPWGLVVTTDSVFYMQAAKSLAVGEGVVNYGRDGLARPMTHYPPLYPAALALGSFAGIGLDDWAGGLQVILFAVNVMLGGWIAFYMSGRVRAVGIAALVLFGTVHFIQAHAGMLSEALFMALMLLVLWCWMRYREERAWAWVLTAAVLTGVACMTRYAGLALLLAGALLLWGCRARWRDGLMYAVAAGCLPLVWAWRNMALSGKPVGFAFGVSSNMFIRAAEGVDALTLYLFPASLPLVLRWVLALVVVGAAAVMYRRAWHGFSDRLKNGMHVLGVFVWVYLAGAFFSLACSNGNMVLDTRLFLPVTLSVVVGVAAWLGSWNWPRFPWARWVLAAAVLAVMLARTFAWAVKMHRHGDGYRGRSVAVAEVLRGMSDQVAVYTDDAQAFYAHAARTAITIPSDPGHPFDVEKARAAFVDAGAVAVIFNVSRFAPEPAWWQMARAASLAVAWRSGEAVIYVARAPRGGT